MRADPVVSVVAVSVSKPPEVEEGAYAVYGGSTVRMHARAHARTLTEAMEAASSAASRAIDAALASARSEGAGRYIGEWQGHAYPVGSTAASWNAHL